MTVDSLHAVMSSIRHRMGMGVIVSHLAYEDIRKGRIVPVSTPRKEIINRISLVQLQDKVPSLTDKTFQTFLKRPFKRGGGRSSQGSLVCNPDDGIPIRAGQPLK
jgi:hypothetical protein